VKLIVQRVNEAAVKVEDQTVGQIGKGVLVFFGVHKEDTHEKVSWLAQKLIHLRLFSDQNKKMNLSLREVEGAALIVSQFTLYANCLESRRPDFSQTAPPQVAQPLYEQFVAELKKELPRVETGIFGAEMEVSLINDGPVTFVIER
jgi:D-aminoacyl-tRNA deacylase